MTRPQHPGADEAVPRILHLIDELDPLELRLALQPLLDRLPAQRWVQYAAMCSGRRAMLRLDQTPVLARLPPRFGAQLANLPLLRRCVLDHGIDLVHAWSPGAAQAAAMAIGDAVPVALTCWDPHLERRDDAAVGAYLAQPRAGVICQAALVRRRLIEHGVDPDRCAVVRPGVDFAAINQSRRDPATRKELQLEPHHRTVLLAPPPSRRGGHLEALWIVEMGTRLMPEIVLLVPGLSSEQGKMNRYLHGAPNEAVVRLTGDDYTFEQLLGITDLLLVAATDDISTTPLAWAMAASVPVLAWATYSVTEFIADGHNGHLVKPGEKTMMMGKLINVLRDRSANAKAYDLARSQAFESFGMTRYVDQVAQAWSNLLAARPIGTELMDAALDVAEGGKFTGLQKNP